MKNVIMILFASILVFSGCKKKESTTMVVKVPSFELIGPAAYSTIPGTGSYQDPGVRYSDEEGNVSILTTPTSSNVDLTSNGFYTASYEKKTEHGYNLKANRLILITPVPAVEDYSGVYTRVLSNGTLGTTVNITKVGTGLYKTDNVGGVANNANHIYDVYFGKLDNTGTLMVPTQVCPLDGSDISCNNAQISVVGQDTIIQWYIDNGNYNPATLRKFVK